MVIFMKTVSLLFCVLALAACSTSTKQQENQPKRIISATPAYPAKALSKNIKGKVSIDFDIDAEGKVSEIRITESEPPQVFDDLVMQAVSQWRYETGKPFKNNHVTIYFKTEKP